MRRKKRKLGLDNVDGKTRKKEWWKKKGTDNFDRRDKGNNEQK
jgi:hypothetical protein